MRKIAVALVLCAVVLSAAVATTTVSALPAPRIRDFPVTGAKTGMVGVNMMTGAFACIANGLSSGTTYYLQYQVTGQAGAVVIGSGVANRVGKVIITGRLDTNELTLIQSPGTFFIGQYVR